MSSTSIHPAHGKIRNGEAVVSFAKDRNGEWQEINDQEGIEEEFMAEKKARFSQATKAKSPLRNSLFPANLAILQWQKRQERY